MWSSEEARNAAVVKLLSRRPGLARLWRATGPSPLAVQYLEQGSPLSSGEVVLLKVAFDLWNGRGKATVDDLLSTLDEDNLRAVCEAILERDAR